MCTPLVVTTSAGRESFVMEMLSNNEEACSASRANDFCIGESDRQRPSTIRTTAALHCPDCESTFVCRSVRHGLCERILKFFRIVPWRCMACLHRFFALRR